MQARLSSAGFDLTDDVESSDAVIINTCWFISEATEEAIATILEVAALSHFTSDGGQIIVTGCMPSRYKEELADELFEVAAFVSCADEENIVNIVRQVLGLSPGEEVQPAFLRTTTSAWAYVKIADGCDRLCSYCTIPLIKGSYRSAPPEEIIAEVAGLVSGGVREIILIAQDTGRWGRDLKLDEEAPIRVFSDLLEALALRFTDTWFRVMYLQPEGITDQLLDVMAAFDNICPYLDIPLQHASARVLREMNRSGSREEYLRLLERIREKLPDAAIRTTMIAGFPGETRGDAAELESFIEEAAFDYVGVFVYSQEDGTVAGGREDQVPLRTRKARAQRLRDLADSVGFQKAAERVGLVEEVLVTGCDEDATAVENCDVIHSRGVTGDQDAAAHSYPMLGRTKRQAPEVDGMVHLDRGNIGELLSATIVQAYCYELDGKVSDAPDE